MELIVRHDIGSIARHFRIAGKFVAARPWGTGHINDTYMATYTQSGAEIRYVHQRINQNVFKDPVSVMDNIERVTTHIRTKVADMVGSDIGRRTLTLVPTRDDLSYYRDPAGDFWRTYVAIEKARTFEVARTPEQAYKAAEAFGAFQAMLLDLEEPRLNETIPDFHDTAKRFAAFRTACAADVYGRAERAEPEIEFALEREPIVSVLIGLYREGKIPERVTHNDTKFNNVMFDDTTGEGICVIDLDTVMPGLVLYDFGDMVRTATSPADEDERDLSTVHMQMPMFEALARGYISSAGTFLNEVERRYLAFSGKLITFEIGLRFLTDYLSGDTYFKTDREGHNLDRCRTQFRLVESIEAQEEEMNRFVAGLDT